MTETWQKLNSTTTAFLHAATQGDLDAASDVVYEFAELISRLVSPSGPFIARLENQTSVCTTEVPPQALMEASDRLLSALTYLLSGNRKTATTIASQVRGEIASKPEIGNTWTVTQGLLLM